MHNSPTRRATSSRQAFDRVALPTLVIVSGPVGTGKTTLAHELGRLIPCPAICRDEIKEGMVHSVPGFKPAPGDPLTLRTFGVFFDVLELLLKAGVSVVAEAAFRDKVWRPRLEPLQSLAEFRIIHCRADPAVVRERIADRALRAAHATRHGSSNEKGSRRRPFSSPLPGLHHR